MIYIIIDTLKFQPETIIKSYSALASPNLHHNNYRKDNLASPFYENQCYSGSIKFITVVCCSTTQQWPLRSRKLSSAYCVQDFNQTFFLLETCRTILDFSQKKLADRILRWKWRSFLELHSFKENTRWPNTRHTLSINQTDFLFLFQATCS